MKEANIIRRVCAHYSDALIEITDEACSFELDVGEAFVDQNALQRQKSNLPKALKNRQAWFRYHSEVAHERTEYR